jgi:hypothetical protein
MVVVMIRIRQYFPSSFIFPAAVDKLNHSQLLNRIQLLTLLTA